MRGCATDGVVAWHRTLRKAFHSFCSPTSCIFGPNLPDVWVPREHTPPHTLFPESLQCKFYDVNLKFYDPLKPLLWSVYINMFYFLFLFTFSFLLLMEGWIPSFVFTWGLSTDLLEVLLLILDSNKFFPFTNHFVFVADINPCVLNAWLLCLCLINVHA